MQAVLEGRPARPDPTSPLSPDDSLEIAWAKVLADNVERLKKETKAIPDDGRSDAIHDARVATRRILTIGELFADAADGRADRASRELQRLGRRLGAVRDLDVLLETLATYTAALDSATERMALRPLCDAWERERARAQARVLRELRGKRYRSAERDLERLAGRVPQFGPENHPVSVAMAAASRIFGAQERLAAFAIDAQSASVEVLHEVRKTAKGLRYAMEAFTDVLPNLEPLIEEVVALQDDAGSLHDAVVAADRARQFAAEHAGAGDAVERFAASRDNAVGPLRLAMAMRLPRLTGSEFRRDLCRVVVR